MRHYLSNYFVQYVAITHIQGLHDYVRNLHKSKIFMNVAFFGIGRFITNQQNIYMVTPVHYLQKAEKKT